MAGNNEKRYDFVKNYKDDCAAIKLDGKWGFIDETGKEICKIKYDDVWSFKDGYAELILNCIRHFIDEKGREKIN